MWQLLITKSISSDSMYVIKRLTVNYGAQRKYIHFFPDRFLILILVWCHMTKSRVLWGVDRQSRIFVLNFVGSFSVAADTSNSVLVSASLIVLHVQYESKKIPPPCCLQTFFPKRLGIFNKFFTHLLCVSIYARLQIFIQLSPTLTKLCHSKRDHPSNFLTFH